MYVVLILVGVVILAIIFAESNKQSSAVVAAEFRLYLEDPHTDNAIFTEIQTTVPHFQLMVDKFNIETKDGFIELIIQYYAVAVASRVKPGQQLRENLANAISMLEAIKQEDGSFDLLNAKMKLFLNFVGLGQYDISITKANIKNSINLLIETKGY